MANEQPTIYRLKLIQKRQELGSIHTLRFEPLDPVPFRAGQWLHLAAARVLEGRELVRHMSIASAPADGWLEFTMDLGSGSEYKRRLSVLEPDAEVAAFKVRGEFIVDEVRDSRIVFIAGGLGITPIRAIVRDLLARKSSIQWSLLHVARAGYLFESELGRFPNAQLRCNRSGLDAMWAKAVEDAGNETTFFLCGSERFVQGMQERLERSGIPLARVRIENFK